MNRLRRKRSSQSLAGLCEGEDQPYPVRVCPDVYHPGSRYSDLWQCTHYLQLMVIVGFVGLIGLYIVSWSVQVQDGQKSVVKKECVGGGGGMARFEVTADFVACK